MTKPVSSLIGSAKRLSRILLFYYLPPPNLNLYKSVPRSFYHTSRLVLIALSVSLSDFSKRRDS